MTMSDVSVADRNPRASIGGNQPPPLRAILAEQYEHLGTAIEGILDRQEKAPEKVASDDDDAAIGVIVVDARKVAKDVEEARDREGRPHLEAKREIDGYFKTLGDRLLSVVRDLELRGKLYRDEKLAASRREAEKKQREADEEAARQRQLAAAEEARGRPNAAARHTDKAEQEEEAALAAASAASARASEITRHRTDGVTGSTKTEWKFEVTDYDALQATLGTLGPYFMRADIDKAVRAFVKFNRGSKPLAGVRFTQETKATYR